MNIISHRGNLYGPAHERENTQDYIVKAIEAGFDVEVDVWREDKTLFLGHDKPEREVKLKWLEHYSDSLWLHCKNFAALDYLMKGASPCFFHENEKFSVISNGMIWAHSLGEANENCIIPLLAEADVDKWMPRIVAGICTDYPFECLKKLKL